MNLQEKVAGFIEARKIINQGLAPLLEQLKDGSIDLNERWKAYTELVNNDILINEDPYGDGFIDELGDLTMYDDFYVERHETRTFPDMYDQIMEADGDYQKRLVAAREANLTKWQEKVLASGLSAFRYDW